MTDFLIYKWGNWWILNALTSKGQAWFNRGWRDRGQPPSSRASKDEALIKDIVYFWKHQYHLTFRIMKEYTA